MMSKRNLLCWFGSLGVSAAVLCAVRTGWAQTDASIHKGFAMPDEAFEHERTFMQWPVNRQVYPDSVFLDLLQQTIATIANTIADFEPVVMLMDARHTQKARQKLSSAIEIWDIATDDLWCRDSGPVFVVNQAGELAVSHLNFNGWGNKQTHDNDGLIASKIAKRMGVPLLDNGLVGEAGGVESNGEGTLIAHESSWINPNRNKGSKAEIEALMLEAFGAQKLIWAPGVAGGDITDYHIDALARFVGPNKVLIQMPDEIHPDDPWLRAAFETYDVLENATNAAGEKLELIVLGEPVNPRVKAEDFVAAYPNYYICNGAVIAAQFGDKRADSYAAELLRELYPNREVVMLNIDPVGEVGGGIHCATQQQPKV